MVGLDLRSDPAETPERILQAKLQRQARLRLTRHGPLPVGIRQNDVAQQMRIGDSSERDAELVGMSPIDLNTRSGLADLREKHFLRRTIL